jgi:hypothetical protein
MQINLYSKPYKFNQAGSLMRRLTYFSALALSILMVSGCAQGGFGSGYDQPTRLDVARVISVQQVATGNGHSNESKLIRGVLGALTGAAINRAFTAGDQDTYVVVQTRNGSTMNVRQDARDLVSGDCVQVETRYNGDIRLYRASSTQCNF